MIVMSFPPKSAGKKAGLLRGDRLTRVDGKGNITPPYMLHVWHYKNNTPFRFIIFFREDLR